MRIVEYNGHVIRPGHRGPDVRATKHAMLRMHTKGSGALGKTNFAGAQWVECIETVQRHHHQRVDGIYGKHTHAVIAPHFSSWDKILYKRARERVDTYPPVPPGGAQANAKKLVNFHKEGRYRADNPADYNDILRTAEGKSVWSHGGYWVHMDERVMELLVWLIEQGYKIGTFALCSDHLWDGPHGHAGGKAVDISSINGISVGAYSAIARELTLKVAILVHSHTSGEIRPWQEITDGYGHVHDSAISAQTIPGYSFYGFRTMRMHEDHIHVGFYV